MPWWSKKRSRDDPEVTPRLASIALPDESSIRPPSRLDDRWATTSIPKIRPVDSSLRSKTPHASSSKHVAPDGPERPRTTSVTAGGRPIKGILKTSKPVDANENKKPLVAKDSEEVTKSHGRRRSSSASNGPPKGILKPAKPVVEDDYLHKPVIPSIPNKGGSLGATEDPSAYQKSSIKGGRSYPSSKEKDLENSTPNAFVALLRFLICGLPASPRAAYPERYGQAPPSHYYQGPPIAPQPVRPVIPQRLDHPPMHSGMPSHYYPQPGYVEHPSAYAPQRTASYAGYSRQPPTHPFPHRAPSYAPPPQPSIFPATPHQGIPYTMQPGYAWPDNGQGEQQYRPGAQNAADPFPASRYVKPTVTRKFVPQKDETISLSWPFIDPSTKPPNHQRRGFPPLFFDVGMDPTADRIGVRAYISDSAYTRPLKEEEKNLPASTHCVVTKMIIYAKDMERWPITAERADGLRCIDIFEAIYRTFAVPLTPQEKSEFTPEFLASCIPAFQQRCRDGPGITAVNEARGLCRVDTLRTQRIFKGLSKQGREIAWTLTLGRPQENPTH